MSIDADRHQRLLLLRDLAIASPNKSMKKLQREALKYYPLGGKEMIRNWMSYKTAEAAVALITEDDFGRGRVYGDIN